MSSAPIRLSPDTGSSGYWDAARRNELALPVCDECGNLTLPPAPVCPNCGTTAPRWRFTPVSGRGTVRSWTLVRNSFHPAFDHLVPYLVADVELDAQPGLRVVGRLLDEGAEPPRLGDRVQTSFQELADGLTVPGFVREHT